MNRGSMRQEFLSEPQQVIIDMLPNGYPSITSTAARNGISAWTLQRRLAESGVNYGEFVARVRFEQARRDLKKPI